MLAVLICALLRCCWRNGGTVDLLGLPTDDTSQSSSTTANDAHEYTAVTGQRSSSSSSGSSAAVRSAVSSADAAAAREGVAVCCVTAAAACAAVELLSGWRGPDGTHQQGSGGITFWLSVTAQAAAAFMQG